MSSAGCLSQGFVKGYLPFSSPDPFSILRVRPHVGLLKRGNTQQQIEVGRTYVRITSRGRFVISITQQQAPRSSTKSDSFARSRHSDISDNPSQPSIYSKFPLQQGVYFLVSGRIRRQGRAKLIPFAAMMHSLHSSAFAGVGM